MNTKPLGRLNMVDLRSYWKREDTHFTPWMAEEENITLLGETVGIELEVQEQEANVAPFRADILCRNTADNTLVLIENQLERTDHTHLGQLLTYAAGLDAVTLIWVVERFREEHRAALDWLNRITDDGFHFFGIEVELWQIGNSVPAPKFNVVAKPNDWSKTVREAAQGRAKGLTAGQQSQVDYWTSFATFVSGRDTSIRPPNPYPSNWMGYGVGRTGAQLIAVVNRGEAAVQLETENRDHPAWFHLLLHDQKEIESELGFSLSWEEKPGNKWSNIRVRMEADTRDPDQWPKIHSWMLEKLETMRRVFKVRVKGLDERQWMPPD
jgi:hypothetical protein